MTEPTISSRAIRAAALSTRQLALGIAQIDSTARALRDQAEQLKSLVAEFSFEESGATVAPRRLAAPPAALTR